MRLGRRSVLIGVAATACVGCRREPSAPLEATAATPSVEEARPEGAGQVGSFGSAIPLGPIDDVHDQIIARDGFWYLPEARVWMVAYPTELVEAARALYDAETVAGLERGLLALHQKCTHLGCRVPECVSSERFECPCHGSIFNRAGEWIVGPAPRGMDRFPLRFDGDDVVIDTSVVLQGLDRGLQTIDDDPPGPSCIGA